MRNVHAIAWLLLAALTGAAGAAPRAGLDARIDAVYLELGRGDKEEALAHSAALLDEVAPRDRRRADVLAMRLDVLAQSMELNKPSGAALQAAIDAYVAAGGKHALAERFAIAQTYDRGDGAGALKLAEAALAAAAKAEQPELQVWVARIAAFSGHLPQAREQAELARSAWKPVPGTHARWLEIELDYIIGQIQTYTGSNEDALRTLRDASQLAISAFGADANERFKIDSVLAGVYSDMGRHRESLEVREMLFGVAQRRYGASSFPAAKAESLLGASLQEIGDYSSARARYEHAQGLVAALPDAPAQERGIISVNYGNLLQEMDELDASVVQYQRALTLIGEGEATRHARAIVYANMGNSKLRLHHYDAAVADYLVALELREQSDGKDNPGLAYALEGLGSASLALQHGAQAETYFRRALALRERALSPNHPSMAPISFGLALSRWVQGDSADAFRIAVQTAEHQQALLSTFAADFSERQSVAYRDILMPVTALVVTLAAERADADSIATAWRLTMVERGLVARTEAHRLAAVRAAHDPEVAAAFDAWRRANTALGDAWLGKSQDAQQLKDLTGVAESAERALWHQCGQHNDGLGQVAVDLGELAHALPRDGTLIAYSEGISADRNHLPVTLDRPVADDWYAFTLHADGKPRLMRLGGIHELTAQARAWYVDLRNPKSDPAQLRRDGDTLRRAVLDPLLDRNAQRLFIVPEGELYRLSFAALPGKDKGYLIESGVRVHTLANETDLSLAPLQFDKERTLLAGAPNFAAAAPSGALASRQLCLRAARDGFAAIPNAARELDDLDALFAASSTSGQIHMVRGADATKQNVLAALAQANVVHLATHGFSLDESCAEAESSRGVTLQPAPGMDAPGSALSGLAFSGASVSDGAAPVGVLSAAELATLDLSQVSWIALSACDSGLGPIGRNEGVFGMRRALRLAGARTVVMSLWQVDDEATADLMASLYRARFVAHADVPDAMATAMRSVIDARRAKGLPDHPYYWAAFIGEGGWR
jgi:CHAT domain-containing protein/tetratricopeptide (TPR) repeat protein